MSSGDAAGVRAVRAPRSAADYPAEERRVALPAREAVGAVASACAQIGTDDLRDRRGRQPHAQAAARANDLEYVSASRRRTQQPQRFGEVSFRKHVRIDRTHLVANLKRGALRRGSFEEPCDDPASGPLAQQQAQSLATSERIVPYPCGVVRAWQRQDAESACRVSGGRGGSSRPGSSLLRTILVTRVRPGHGAEGGSPLGDAIDVAIAPTRADAFTARVDGWDGEG